MRIGLLIVVLAAALMSTGVSAEIRVASWNMNNLHHQLEEPLRPGAPARTEANIEILKEWRALATRCERTARSFLGVLCLAAPWIG